MCKKERNPRLEQEDKRRCAEFLLRMIEKYGAKIMADQRSENGCQNAQISSDRD